MRSIISLRNNEITSFPFRSHTVRWISYLVFGSCFAVTVFNLREATQTILLPTTTTPDPLSPMPSAEKQTIAILDPTLHSENHRMDPTFLRRQTQHLNFWNVLDYYGHLSKDNAPLYSNRTLSSSTICQPKAGQGYEAPGGYQILTQKLQLAKSPSTTTGVRLLCAVYTHPLLHQLVRAAALTWGRRCDGFVAMSTQTIPQLNILELRHAGPEEYQNMWQKVRRPHNGGRVTRFLQNAFFSSHDTDIRIRIRRAAFGCICINTTETTTTSFILAEMTCM